MPEVDIIQELTRDEYEARQRSEVAPSGLQRRAATLAPSGQFLWDGRSWNPQPYPGYAFQAMASATRSNADTTDRLSRIRDEIVACLPAGNLCPLPTASFHQTVVNTFSAQRRQQFLIEAGLDGQFPDIIRKALGDEPVPRSDIVRMDLIGVSLFRTALGALGVFSDPAHFARVLHVRDRVYGQPDLIHLGLKRTRPFIGHVTLVYVEADLPGSWRETLVQTISRLNRSLFDDPLPFFMPVAALHHYEDLAEFVKPVGYPQLCI